MKRIMSFLLIVIALGFGACTATVIQEGEHAAAAVLLVDNQRTSDETIYLEHAGVKGRRLGIVGALSQKTFALTESDIAATAEVTFLAKSFADGWTDLSDPMAAVAGVRYVWQLAPMRGNSFISSQRSAE